jgi:hypothetical protein
MENIKNDISGRTYCYFRGFVVISKGKGKKDH